METLIYSEGLKRMKKDLIDFCKNHIESLTEKLDEIYTITDGEKTINVRKELVRLDFYESIYSTLERNNGNEGSIYEQYINYLKSVRNKKARYIQEKQKIEVENKVDIENIRLLLQEFNQELRTLEQ